MTRKPRITAIQRAIANEKGETPDPAGEVLAAQFEEARKSHTRAFFHSEIAAATGTEYFAVVQTAPKMRHILEVTHWQDFTGDISDESALKRFKKTHPDLQDARLKDRFPVKNVLVVGDSATIFKFMLENSHASTAQITAEISGHSEAPVSPDALA